MERGQHDMFLLRKANVFDAFAVVLLTCFSHDSLLSMLRPKYLMLLVVFSSFPVDRVPFRCGARLVSYADSFALVGVK